MKTTARIAAIIIGTAKNAEKKQDYKEAVIP